MFQWKNLCDKEMVSNINVMRILNNAQAQIVLQSNRSIKVAGHCFFLYILSKNETLRGL